MGGWTFIRDRLNNPKYVGRSSSASPATGSYSIHQKEQTELVAEALKV
jgi:2-oxoglutarate dehydrogenase E1 component